MRPRTLRLHPMTAKKLLRLRGEDEGDGSCRVAKRIHAGIRAPLESGGFMCYLDERKAGE